MIESARPDVMSHFERALVFAFVACASPLAAAQEPQPQTTEPVPNAMAQGPSVDDSRLSGPEESCRARTDCQHGLKCVGLHCIDEHAGETCGATADCGGRLKCIHHKCAAPGASVPSGNAAEPSAGGARGQETQAREAPAPAGERSERARFDVNQGVHPFVGFSLGVGLVVFGADLGAGLQTSGPEGALVFALRGGVLLDHHELALEVSPFTYAYAFLSAPGTTFRVGASYAYRPTLLHTPSVSVSWPLRVGFGFFTGNTFDNVWTELRVDAVSLALSVGHFVLEANLPSFRWGVPPAEGAGALPHFFTFLFGVNAAYAF